MPRAFTLIEAMIVIAIAGIMAALAVGLGSDFVRREQARDDVEQVRAHLVGARNHARRNAACVAVRRSSPQVLDAAVVVDAALQCPAAPHAPAPQQAQTTLRVATSVSAFSVDGVSVDAVIFRPDGSLPLASPAVITITTGDVRPTTLAIWPAAGVVKNGAPP